MLFSENLLSLKSQKFACREGGFLATLDVLVQGRWWQYGGRLNVT